MTRLIILAKSNPVAAKEGNGSHAKKRDVIEMSTVDHMHLMDLISLHAICCIHTSMNVRKKKIFLTSSDEPIFELSRVKTRSNCFIKVGCKLALITF